MVKYITFVISMAFANFSYAQAFSISTYKQSYYLMDTIQLKIVNLNSIDRYMAIGLETEFENFA